MWSHQKICLKSTKSKWPHGQAEDLIYIYGQNQLILQKRQAILCNARNDRETNAAQWFICCSYMRNIRVFSGCFLPPRACLWHYACYQCHKRYGAWEWSTSCRNAPLLAMCLVGLVYTSALRDMLSFARLHHMGYTIAITHSHWPYPTCFSDPHWHMSLLCYSWLGPSLLPRGFLC